MHPHEVRQPGLWTIKKPRLAGPSGVHILSRWKVLVDSDLSACGNVRSSCCNRRIRRNFIEYEIYLGRGLFFLNSIRRAFRRQGTDTNLHVIFELSKDYWMWLTDLISGKKNFPDTPDKGLPL